MFDDAVFVFFLLERRLKRARFLLSFLKYFCVLKLVYGKDIIRANPGENLFDDIVVVS